MLNASRFTLGSDRHNIAVDGFRTETRTFPPVADQKPDQGQDNQRRSTIPTMAGGGRFKLIEHNDCFAIYRSRHSYEVVRIRFNPPDHAFAPDQFNYPAPSEWGFYAWSATSIEFAREIMQLETKRLRKRNP